MNFVDSSRRLARSVSSLNIYKQRLFKHVWGGHFWFHPTDSSIRVFPIVKVRLVLRPEEIKRGTFVDLGCKFHGNLIGFGWHLRNYTQLW